MCIAIPKACHIEGFLEIDSCGTQLQLMGLCSKLKDDIITKMAKINSFTFGSITIDGVAYNHDIYILPSGKVEERSYGHTFTKEQVEHVLKENPEVIVTGKGTSGCANLSADAKVLLEKKGIEVIEANTPDIKDKFNELNQMKKAAAIIHVTC